MASNVRKIEQTIATERFEPELNAYYRKKFHEIVEKMDQTLPFNRVELVKQELELVLTRNQQQSLERLKYASALSLLSDLLIQGWTFQMIDGTIFLKMENENVDDKDTIRYRLSAERLAQFKEKSVARFISNMEKEHDYNGEAISIKDLIGSKDFLLDKISNNERICDPYVQLVTKDRDDFSGYRLCDIWRYFRYTWSIPYKTMPGRNIFYLVRDRLQKHHPIIGIFALGNSVLNLSVRDDDIGWTVESIKHNMQRMSDVAYCEQLLSGMDGKGVKVKINTPKETKDEYEVRTDLFSEKTYPLLVKSINTAISEIYTVDLGYDKRTKSPTREKVNELLNIAAEYSEKSINNKNNETNPDWRAEAQTNLFTRKRASELAKLLLAKIAFNEAKGETCKEKLNYMLASEDGRRAINTALVSIRKQKIGSNMMDIIVCGSIPPYNELLGGKLVSILACSPQVISDYTCRYAKQVSEIASRMKGEKVVRDSQLAYLGTTSLYAVGSSQYNRIKIPRNDSSFLEYRKMGITEGYGTVFFSKDTTDLFSKMLEIADGGKRINHVFGEGTSPRFRMISRGLANIGIRADAFLKHYSPRIVYSINLAKNTNEFLMGYEDKLDYNFNLDDDEDVNRATQELIDYWYERWLKKRLTTVDIKDRLEAFRESSIMLGNY